MPTTSQIAEKFTRTDIHDDTVEGFAFHPAEKRGAKAKVNVTLFRHWKGSRRLLTFNDCANVEVVIDGDVLRDNAPNNTHSFQGSADPDLVEAAMRKHRRTWNVKYDKSIDPMSTKTSKVGEYVLFKVRLFGGNLLVVARKFTIKQIKE
jgi:hypothetical protein